MSKAPRQPRARECAPRTNKPWVVGFRVFEGKGKTGNTFAGIIELERKHYENLMFSLFENVLGLGSPPTRELPDGTKVRRSLCVIIL